MTGRHEEDGRKRGLPDLFVTRSHFDHGPVTLHERVDDDGWVALSRSPGVAPIRYETAMPHIIAWCGFLGAWLLVAGPLDQAVREIEETGFEHERLEEAAARVEELAPVSRWWMLLPPVRWLRSRRRDSIHRHLVGEAMEGLCVGLTVGRTRGRHHRPAVEG